MENQRLIIELISEDIRNNKLIVGLNNLGMDASEYASGLSVTILQLMGFTDTERTDNLYEQYDTKLSAVTPDNADFKTEELNALALEIYIDLLAEKKVLERPKREIVQQ
jgi:hypothetical protein